MLFWPLGVALTHKPKAEKKKKIFMFPDRWQAKPIEVKTMTFASEIFMTFYLEINLTSNTGKMDQ